MKQKNNKKIEKEIYNMVDKTVNKGIEIGIKKGNIAIDYLEDVIHSSIQRGYTGINNGVMLKYLKDAREILNNKE